MKAITAFLLIASVLGANNLGKPGARVAYILTDPSTLAEMDGIPVVESAPVIVWVTAWALNPSTELVRVELRYRVAGPLRGEFGEVRRETREIPIDPLGHLTVSFPVEPQRGRRVSASRVVVMSIRIEQVLGADEFVVGPNGEIN